MSVSYEDVTVCVHKIVTSFYKYDINVVSRYMRPKNV